jgi:hypothetical protein
MKGRFALFNSSVAYAVALLATITWHEFGHALAAKAQGLSPTMHAFSVDTHTTSDRQELITALAGPVLSLVTGLGFLALHRVLRRSGFWPLVALWMGLAGVQTFSGYLITGLFFPRGDIGVALQLSHAPAGAGVLVFLAGWVITYANGRYATQQLMMLTDEGEPLAPQLRSLGLFAWLLGTALALVLSVGSYDFGSQGAAIATFEILGTLTTGIFLIFVRQFMKAVPAGRQAPAWSVPYLGIAVLVVVAAVRQFAIGGGVTL